MILKKFIGDFKTRTIIPIAETESLPRPQQQGLYSSSMFRLQSNLVHSLWMENQALGPHRERFPFSLTMSITHLTTWKSTSTQNTVAPPLSLVLFSEVLVTHSQPQCENIKWKIPEINNS